MNELILFPLAFIATFMSWRIVVLIYPWATRNLLDEPCERSAHSTPTPTGGGLAIVLTTLLLLVLTTFLVTPGELSISILVYVVAGATLAVIGWIDDFRDLSIRLRLAFHIFAALAILLATGGGSQTIDVPLVGSLNLAAVAILINFVWLVGFINAFNFMDGIDGIATMQAIVASLGWLLLPIENRVIDWLALLICFSALGFLFMNWHPARIFMGDTGSTFLGLTLAAFPFLINAKTADPNVFIVGIMFVAPFVFDAGFTFVRRLLNGENVLQAHQTHLYQRLVKSGLSHAVVTTLYGALGAICVGLGTLYYAGSDELRVFCLIGVALLCFMLYRVTVTIECGVFAQQIRMKQRQMSNLLRPRSRRLV